MKTPEQKKKDEIKEYKKNKRKLIEFGEDEFDNKKLRKRKKQTD